MVLFTLLSSQVNTKCFNLASKIPAKPYKSLFLIALRSNSSIKTTPKPKKRYSLDNFYTRPTRPEYWYLPRFIRRFFYAYPKVPLYLLCGSVLLFLMSPYLIRNWYYWLIMDHDEYVAYATAHNKLLDERFRYGTNFKLPFSNKTFDLVHPEVAKKAKEEDIYFRAVLADKFKAAGAQPKKTDE